MTALAAACAVCGSYLGATLEQLPSKGHHSQQHISTSIVHKQDGFAVCVLLEAGEDGIKVIQDLVAAAVVQVEGVTHVQSHKVRGMTTGLRSDRCARFIRNCIEHGPAVTLMQPEC